MSSANRLNLVIPMAGRGQRFRDAGFETYKPFIPIGGKPMVAHVTDAFPNDVRKFVVAADGLLSDDQTAYLHDELNCEVIVIKPHKDGPAYSILRAADRLPLDEAFFISYCDIYWTWDFDDIRPLLGVDGIVFTHQGFHPHLIGNSFSAFCRPGADDPRTLVEIREKAPFTDDWMNEPLSIGAFFVHDGRDMIAAIDRLVEDDERVGGEFFPSLLFNDMVGAGKQVQLAQVNFFIHWGVPNQLKDFQRWGRIVEALSVGDGPRGPMVASENVICMAGLGSRMRGVSEMPKALIPIDGRPMFEFVARRFPCRRTAIVTTAEIADTIESIPHRSLIVLDRQTSSQFETLHMAAADLARRREFFLTSCDAFGLMDFAAFGRFVEDTRPEVVIFTFEPSLTHAKMSAHHTHVSVENGAVSAVHVKSFAGPDDHGLAGFFWVADGAVFECLDAIEVPAKGKPLVDHVFAHLVETGRRVLAYPVTEYVHLGTPEEFLEFKYWSDRQHVFGRHGNGADDGPAGATPQ